MSQRRVSRVPSLRTSLLAIILLFGTLLAPLGKTPPSVVGAPISVFQQDGPRLPGFVWYPVVEPSPEPRSATAGGLPLIVVSHGLWGSSRTQDGLMRALAEDGFIAAAVDHSEYKGYFLLAPEKRTAQLHGLIDYMLQRWPLRAQIDPHRIGAFGFSLGGLTVLVAAGGKPDLALMPSHCKQAPEEWSCMMERTKRLDFVEHPPPVSAWVADSRIKAASVLAPAMGYLFGGRGLANVEVPIQLWQGDHDSVLHAPWNAEIVQRELPHPAEYNSVGGDHADLLTSCSQITDRQPNCAGRQADFHLRVANFFRQTLH